MIPLSDENRTRTFPFVNYAIIALNFLVFFYQLSLGSNLENFFYSWATIPAEITQGRDIGAPTVDPHFLTMFSSMFMHGGWAHILGNMLYLWIFGDNLEDNMGHIKYTIFYFLCGLLASGAHIVSQLGSEIPSLGASGAIAGVLGAYLVLYPSARVRTLVPFGGFMSMTMVPAIMVIGLWAVLQFVNGFASIGPATEQSAGVAWFAHIGGFIAGVVLIFLFGNRTAARTQFNAR